VEEVPESEEKEVDSIGGGGDAVFSE